MKKHLFLTGFMGSGKTTIGQSLANALNQHFVDLDSLIIETVGKSIKTIFTEDGEDVFRGIETSCLCSLADLMPSVVSTGGGVIGRAENVKFMHDNGTLVYLSAEWPTLEQRLAGSTDRPLANSENGWSTTKELFIKRCPLYGQADITITTDEKTVQEIVDEIKYLI